MLPLTWALCPEMNGWCGLLWIVGWATNVFLSLSLSLRCGFRTLGPNSAVPFSPMTLRSTRPLLLRELPPWQPVPHPRPAPRQTGRSLFPPAPSTSCSCPCSPPRSASRSSATPPRSCCKAQTSSQTTTPRVHRGACPPWRSTVTLGRQEVEKLTLMLLVHITVSQWKHGKHLNAQQVDGVQTVTSCRLCEVDNKCIVHTKIQFSCFSCDVSICLSVYHEPKSLLSSCRCSQWWQAHGRNRTPTWIVISSLWWPRLYISLWSETAYFIFTIRWHHILITFTVFLMTNRLLHVPRTT